MLDELIAFGSEFDWITPVVTFVQDWQYRPATGYNIPVAGGWSAYAVRDLLQAGGVQIWGLAIVGSTITLRCRQSQARYAQFLMQRAGVQFAGGVK